MGYVVAVVNRHVAPYICTYVCMHVCLMVDALCRPLTSAPEYMHVLATRVATSTSSPTGVLLN